jgi:hypothetical protein
MGAVNGLVLLVVAAYVVAMVALAIHESPTYDELEG